MNNKKEVKKGLNWFEINKNIDSFPKIIKTSVCPNCHYNTLNYYSDNTAICGMCMTWTYEIKK